MREAVVVYGLKSLILRALGKSGDAGSTLYN